MNSVGVKNSTFVFSVKRKFIKENILLLFVNFIGFVLFKCSNLLCIRWIRSQLFPFTSTSWWRSWTSRNSSPWRIPSRMHDITEQNQKINYVNFSFPHSGSHSLQIWIFRTRSSHRWQKGGLGTPKWRCR